MEGHARVCRFAVGIGKRFFIPNGRKLSRDDRERSILERSFAEGIVPHVRAARQGDNDVIGADVDRLFRHVVQLIIGVGEHEFVIADEVVGNKLRLLRGVRIDEVIPYRVLNRPLEREFGDFERARRVVKCKRVVRHLFDGGIHCNVVFADAAYARRIAGCGIGKFGYNARENIFKVIALDQAADEDIPCPAAR